MLSTRAQLWILAFSGFAVNYAVRVNLNIALVEMAKTGGAGEIQEEEDKGGTTPGYCQLQGGPHLLVSNTTTLVSEPLANFTPLPTSSSDSSEPTSWDEYQQGLILGAFYWCHWCTQVAGGVLAQRFGTKRVMGLSQLATSLLAMLIPWAANHGYRMLIALRMAQGFTSGFVWPAMHTMVGRWVPPDERSKFVTSYLGSSLGAALTFPLCGLLMATLGWEAVFYATGLLGVAWSLAWFLLIFDSPRQHPRISQEEKDYIEKSLGLAIEHKQILHTPWKQIFSSRTFWVCTLARWGGEWGLFTLLAHAPIYLSHIHGLSINMMGILTGFPHLCRLLFALLVSAIGDKMLRTGVVNLTGLRKLATSICCIGQGLCMLGLAMSGCDASMAVLFLTAATTLNGAISTGPLASFVDISPNFAGALLGTSGTITLLTGFLSPMLAGVITLDSQTTDSWQLMFLADASMLLVPGVIYIIFSTSELQPWNSLRAYREDDETGEGKAGAEKLLEKTINIPTISS